MPTHLIKPLKAEVESSKEDGGIYGPHGLEHANGWTHNIIVAEMQRMMRATTVKTNKHLIPMMEQLCHNGRGSNWFIKINKEIYLQLPISDVMEEGSCHNDRLMKIETKDAYYWFLNPDVTYRDLPPVSLKNWCIQEVQKDYSKRALISKDKTVTRT